MDSRFSDCSSVSPTHLEDSKVLTASETRKKSTYGQLPIFEFLFARLSKYVSETESHAILNGIQDEIRFAAPPEYTENDETISIGTLDVDGEPSPPYIHPSDCKQNVDHAEAKTASDANDNRRPKRKFVEGMEGHTGATTKKQQVEDSETDYGVVAIKFLDPDFGVWWKGGHYTREPLRNLTGIDCSAIERARTKKGTRVKLTGRRDPAGQAPAVTAPSTQGWYQETQSSCSLNAIANALIQLGTPLSSEQYTTTKLSCSEYKGLLPLESVADKICARGISQFTRLRGQNSFTRFTNLRALTRGVYVVEDEGHVITWNCETQTILDSDRINPDPLPINDENLKLLLQRPRIELAYRVHPCKKKFIN